MAVSARTVVRWLVLLLAVSAAAAAREKRWQGGGASGGGGGQLVQKEWRRVVSASDAGLVTAVDVADAAGSSYRLHFITMSPGTLFLPVQLYADMVFYVHSGRGKVTYIEEGNSESSSLQLERGDVYNFEQGTIIYIQSYPCATRERLQIYAIFASDRINADNPWRPTSEAYSSVSDLLKGFEVEVLRLGFGVPREVVEAIKSTKSPPAIIPYNPEDEDDEEDELNWKEEIADALLGVRDPHFLNKKKKDKHKDKHKGKGKDKKSKSKAFNFFSGQPDVENCYGWSRTMTKRDLETLRGSNIGMFMVNLTTGAMMGPHWNPRATEFAIVIKGSGIVQIVCPSISSGESKRRHRDEDQGGGDDHGHGGGGGGGCKNSVFRVKEGDVFVVPQYHPMAQISFNNDSFVFVGFSTDMGHNHPQFLAGKQSVLQVIGKEILALSLGQENSTAVGRLLSSQRESTIMACTSCAEELERKAEEEEEGGKGEEEERRRQEEEWKRRREEEERRQEEEWKRREEEERERREREEEERRQWEKEEKKREKEEERARREQEEEERRRREQEEEEQEGGGGDEPEPRREEEEEEEGEWGDRERRLSRSLKKRYRGMKSGLFRSA